MKKFKQLIAWLLRFFDLSCEDDRIDYLCGGEALPAPLTPEEEQAVVKRLNDGDVNAKNELIERNLRLVVYIAKRFENTGPYIRRHDRAYQGGEQFRLHETNQTRDIRKPMHRKRNIDAS